MSPKPERAWVPKRLLIFWGSAAVIGAIGGGVLQYLGPPPKAASSAQAGRPNAPPAKPAAKPAPKPAAAAPLPAMMQETGTGSTLAAGKPVPGANPDLLGPSATDPNWLVPKMGKNLLTPMTAYAASAPAGAGPRVAVLVAGIGDDDGQSQQAITSLPAAISMGITPYGAHSADTGTLARAAGHELVLEIPMQEADPATQNAGNEALVMAGPITLNQPFLDWSLSQLQAYAGVTDAFGVTQGAGFMANPDAKAWLLQEIADRGLFFIDARPTGPTPYAWNRTADVLIDPVHAPEKETAQLAELAADAKMQGAALGVLLSPAPNALQTLAAWTQSLAAQKITLVPVSALVLPPNAGAGAALKPGGSK